MNPSKSKLPRRYLFLLIRLWRFSHEEFSKK
jgi:hypothetical protein